MILSLSFTVFSTSTSWSLSLNKSSVSFANWLNLKYPPGLRIVVATVIGWPKDSKISLIFLASAPPEYDIGSLPSNFSESIAAIEIVNGRRALPDIYISSAGSSFLFTSTGKVFVSFTPKARSFFFARSNNLSIITTASSYWRSSLKWKSVKEI